MAYVNLPVPQLSNPPTAAELATYYAYATLMDNRERGDKYLAIQQQLVDNGKGLADNSAELGMMDANNKALQAVADAIEAKAGVDFKDVVALLTLALTPK